MLIVLRAQECLQFSINVCTPESVAVGLARIPRGEELFPRLTVLIVSCRLVGALFHLPYYNTALNKTPKNSGSAHKEVIQIEYEVVMFTALGVVVSYCFPPLKQGY